MLNLFNHTTLWIESLLNFVIILFPSELPKPVEEPEVVESEITIEITAPEEPEPVAPVWVQVYDDLVSSFLVYRLQYITFRRLC